MNDQRKNALINLKKAKGLIEKIIQMIEEDSYCIDIMQQNLAIVGILKSVHLDLYSSHLNHCVKEAFNSKNNKKKQEKIDEIIKLSKFYNKI